MSPQTAVSLKGSETKLSPSLSLSLSLFPLPQISSGRHSRDISPFREVQTAKSDQPRAKGRRGEERKTNAKATTEGRNVVFARGSELQCCNEYNTNTLRSTFFHVISCLNFTRFPRLAGEKFALSSEYRADEKSDQISRRGGGSRTASFPSSCLDLNSKLWR